MQQCPKAASLVTFAHIDRFYYAREGRFYKWCDPSLRHKAKGSAQHLPIAAFVVVWQNALVCY